MAHSSAIGGVLLAYLDRATSASPKMQTDLELTETVYNSAGFSTWGLVSAAMMFAEMFYVMRFFLGVAEAGFFPGIILYLTVIMIFNVATHGVVWAATSGAYGLAGHR